MTSQAKFAFIVKSGSLCPSFIGLHKAVMATDQIASRAFLDDRKCVTKRIALKSVHSKKIVDRVTRYQEERFHERREYVRKYQKKHRRRLLNYIRQRRLDNLDEMRKKEREYRRSYLSDTENRLRLRAYERQWRKNNRGKARAAWHRRRARQRSAGQSFTAQQWEALKQSYNYTCLCCGRQEPEIKLTPDHGIPLGPPGTGEISNIQPLCLSCNSAKGAKTVDYRPLWDGKARQDD